MRLKNIPEGNYTKISAVYIPLIDSTGTCCENCGRLISNIVTVKNEDNSKTYIIGQDCAKNLFSQKENEEIAFEIKKYKADQKRKEESEKREKWQTAFNEVSKLSDEAGIDNSNINTQWARIKYNEILDKMEEKHGIHISYRR
jgi:hypothetical protein